MAHRAGNGREKPPVALACWCKTTFTKTQHHRDSSLDASRLCCCWPQILGPFPPPCAGGLASSKRFQPASSTAFLWCCAHGCWRGNGSSTLVSLWTRWGPVTHFNCWTDSALHPQAVRGEWSYGMTLWPQWILGVIGNAAGTWLGSITKDNLLNTSWGKGQAATRPNHREGGMEKAMQQMVFRCGAQEWEAQVFFLPWYRQSTYTSYHTDQLKSLMALFLKHLHNCPLQAGAFFL